MTTRRQALLGVAFTAAGVSKLMSAPPQVDEFDRFGYPPALRFATGAVELAGALLLFTGMKYPPAARLGGTLIAGTMIGAVGTHVRVGDSPKRMVPPAVLGVLASTVAYENHKALTKRK